MAEGLRNPYKRRTRHKDKITYIELATDAADYNLRDAVGDGPVNVRLKIASGVIISASTPTTIAFQTGTMNHKSTVYLTNNGSILGAGGGGGHGSWRSDTQPIVGGDGGDAITLNLDVTIENNGIIYAGGGGGGGGGGDGLSFSRGGGGGGGGAGILLGTGGIGGTGFVSGFDGAPGTATAGGTGGAGGPTTGGAGGDGGGPAQIGSAGVTPTTTGPFATGATGGGAGVAVNLNGNVVTWVTGNTTSQVKGAQT